MTKSYQRTPNRGRRPPYNFFQRGSKIGLKCNKLVLKTPEPGGVARRNPGTRRVSMLGRQRKHKFWGHRPPQNLGGRKNVQKSVRFTTTFEFERKYLWNR